jgi:hypothetical protein
LFPNFPVFLEPPDFPDYLEFLVNLLTLLDPHFQQIRNSLAFLGNLVNQEHLDFHLIPLPPDYLVLLYFLGNQQTLLKPEGPNK